MNLSGVHDVWNIPGDNDVLTLPPGTTMFRLEEESHSSSFIGQFQTQCVQSLDGTSTFLTGVFRVRH